MCIPWPGTGNVLIHNWRALDPGIALGERIHCYRVFQGMEVTKVGNVFSRWSRSCTCHQSQGPRVSSERRRHQECDFEPDKLSGPDGSERWTMRNTTQLISSCIFFIFESSVSDCMKPPFVHFIYTEVVSGAGLSLFCNCGPRFNPYCEHQLCWRLH